MKITNRTLISAIVAAAATIAVPVTSYAADEGPGGEESKAGLVLVDGVGKSLGVALLGAIWED
ncbi:hypothetical protein [Streptomyces sp. NPDC051921]|uniref:hypothetical protein n=1 Tax=Streptomyces sp. NPDC051921 TaxID=3155806 RepID=UPI00344286CB